MTSPITKSHLHDPMLLESYANSLSFIYEDRERIEELVIEVEEALKGINKELYSKRTLPLEKAIKARNIKQFLTLEQIGAKRSEESLSLAVATGARDIAHKLLMDGYNPDSNNLLSIAIANNDPETAYLLIAYGATCSEHAAKKLKELINPLRITGNDMALFAATTAYWLTTATGNSYLPTLVEVLGGTWFCYNTITPSYNKTYVALTLTALEILPGTNIAMKILRTATLATKAFSAIRAAYSALSLSSAARAAFHSVNALHASYILQNAARFEYSQSELAKSLSQCHKVTTDDIAEIEAVEATERMQWVVDHPHSSDCPPVLERAFPGWSCENFKSKFHEASLTHHPDKNSNKSSFFQSTLNSANRYWKELCRK